MGSGLGHDPKALSEAALSDKVQIVNQSLPVGAANIELAALTPMRTSPLVEIMDRETGRKIYDGSEAMIPTFRHRCSSDLPSNIRKWLVT